MRRKAARASELRAAVDRLPLATRQAMLEGVQTNPIVAGADGDGRGGLCPVYASSRVPSKRIGRPFAQAWDQYADARLPRRASERELRTLVSMLETSIALETEPEVSLHAGIAAHMASQERSRAVASVRRRRSPAARTPAPVPRRDSGERDRTEELSPRHGWAWLRPFRNYDDYERALRTLDCLAREAGSEPERQPLAPCS